MQKRVNFEPAQCGPTAHRVASRVRHCQPGVPSVSRRGSAVTVVEQAPPQRPRAAASHARAPAAAAAAGTGRAGRRAATPVHFLSPRPRLPPPPRYTTQVFTTYPSLVEAIQMKTAEMEKNYHQQQETERQRRPPEPCACRRCASRSLATPQRSTSSVRCFRNNIVQYSERGTMTSVTHDAMCEAQGTQNPANPLSRVISVHRSEVSSVRSIPSNHSDRSRSGSILKRPSQLTGLNFIKYQAEEPERDLHEADSFPQTQQDAFYEEEGYLNGYLDPGGTRPVEKTTEYTSVPYGLGPGEVSVGRERPCKCCSPQMDRDGIPFSHRFSGSRYHKRCARPMAAEFGFYKTTTLGKSPAPPAQPWCPVSNGSNVFAKTRTEGVRRPRRVLSSERNIEMYIGQDDVDHMIRRNRYY